MNFRVDVSVFRGPMDLLLYLVKKHEIDLLDIPIGLIADQFLQHVNVLEQLDVNAVGDFLELASTLLEIKSRLVLPHEDEVTEELEDPRQDLVRQLLEYRKFKEAASMLEERSRAWQERFPRLSADQPERRGELADEPIRETELWDLVSAFGRIMRDRHQAVGTSIVYDDTPIHVFMERIQARLSHDERVAMGDLFQGGLHKSTLVGMFLAVLELVRHHSVRAEQLQLFGEIFLVAGVGIDKKAAENK